jgi:hypothetical protein
MNKLISILAASVFVLSSATALAADPPKDASTMKAPAKLEKPADVTADAWAKMTDAEKQKAVDAAKAKAPASKEAAAPKKEKKGGC